MASEEPAATEGPLERLVRRARAEYLEMPGLRLTAAQAQRLLGLERECCQRVLTALVDVGFLRPMADGTYARAQSDSPGCHPQEGA